jgi:hypothetical protein
MAQRPSATNTEPPLLKPLLKRSNSMSNFDFSFLKEHLEYNSYSGEFAWVKSPARSVKAGSAAGRLRPDGYVNIQIKGKLYFAHRIAWLMTYGEWPEKQIDHINGNRSDNRIANLRKVSRSQNGQNRKPNIGSATGVPGVTWYAPTDRWLVRITLNQKTIHIGYFNAIDEAVSARQTAETRFFTHAPTR